MTPDANAEPLPVADPYESATDEAIALCGGDARDAVKALIVAVRQWKTDKGASRVQVNVTTGANLAATDKLLRAVGAEFVGGSYVV